MKLNAFGIICSDIGASLRFYRALGVKFPEFNDHDVHYEAALGGGIRLMLDSHEAVKSFANDFTLPDGNDIMSLAVEFDEPDGVDAAFATASAGEYGTVREPFDAIWGQRYATITDPDGNHVDLYATISTI